MMASALPMDAADASDLSRRHSGGGGVLAVNKSSGKIGKGLRRPVAQPRPAPTVYKIEAGHFRTLVQELTGTATAELVAPKPIGNTRLQKIAPPPLRPTFSYPKFGPSQPMQQFSNGLPPLPSPTNGQRFTNNAPFSGFGSALSPLSQRIAPFPTMLSPHTFSPLPALSPKDQMWANSLESPNSAAMRQLAQSIASSESQQQAGGEPRLENNNNSNGDVAPAAAAPGQAQNTTSSSSSNSYSLSPRLSQYPNLPSPTGIGMVSGFGIGSIYQMGALHSPTSGMGIDFAFPEPDYMLTGFS